MGILIKGMDEIPEDGAVLVVKHDNGKAYIKHACTYGYSMELVKLPPAQPEIIRCKDCKYRYLDGMIWNCPFGLSGGEDFFCAYGAIGGGSGT